MKKQIITIIVSLFLINLVSAGLYYNVNMHYANNSLNINSVKVIFSDDSAFNSGDYILRTIDNKGYILEENKFHIPNKIIYDYANEGENFSKSEIQELKEVDFNIYIPYYENAKEIVISKNANEVIKYNVQEYNRINIQETEKLKEKIQEQEEADKPKITSEDKTLNIILIIIAVVLAIAVVYSVLVRKKLVKKIHKK